MTDRLDEIRADVEHAGRYISLVELGTSQHVPRNEAIERVRLLHAPHLLAEVERLRAALEGDDFIARCADALHGHRCDQAVGHSLPHRAEFGTTVYRWQPIKDETPEGGES